jgi:hypothetical protein
MMGSETQSRAALVGLRQRLILRQLNEILETERHFLIIASAARAERLATRTGFPLLLFPCLFEEQVAAVLAEYTSASQDQPVALQSPLPDEPVLTTPTAFSAFNAHDYAGGDRRPELNISAGKCQRPNAGSFLILLRQQRRERRAVTHAPPITIAQNHWLRTNPGTKLPRQRAS